VQRVQETLPAEPPGGRAIAVLPAVELMELGEIRFDGSTIGFVYEQAQ
jgi:hypothetical protein